jgi:pimeloyl-ACP methyl ester carboxylesterase
MPNAWISDWRFIPSLSITFVLFANLALAIDPMLSPASAPLAIGLVETLRSELVADQQGIMWAASAAQTDRSKPLVVLVPGMIASRNSMDSLRSAIELESYPVGTFGYASHQGIQSAAAQLSTELRSLLKSDPQRQIILLTHSMGGLVARCCLEHTATNPGNVNRLIMIAPPNHGSAIAGLSAAELARKFSLTKSVGTNHLKTLDETVGCFVGLAKEELQTASTLLQQLNTCSPADDVRYTIIAGSGGPVPAGLADVSLLLGDLLFADRSDTKAALQSGCELARLDEWTRGKGDGVVSIESTRLNGVPDFVILPFAHNDFGIKPSRATDQVVTEVLGRLSD